MAKGGMAQVVAQGDGLGQVLIELQGPGYGAGGLGYFQGVGESGHIVVPFRVDEDLGLVLEAAEGLGVEDAVPVLLEGGAQGAGGLRAAPAAQAAAGSKRGEGFFPLLKALPDGMEAG